ncbi:MAG: hypothetical protein HY225_02500 [Candidatus Vogelbacteria bacterium]|nr:hypothetical protein [Candidatus Vogelbacteria bacterium]
MSYEGYVQVLCENGHYHAFDAYDDVVSNSIDWAQFNGYGGVDQERKPWACFCGKDMVWVNNVDETNCESAGYVELEVQTEAKFCTCVDCGNKHVTEAMTYKIPRGGHGRTRP